MPDLDDKTVRKVIFSFMGEEKAREYVLTGYQRTDLKIAMRHRDQWFEFSEHGTGRKVYVNLDNVKRVIM